MASSSKNKGKKKNNQSEETSKELAWDEIVKITSNFNKRYDNAKKSHFEKERKCLSEIHHKNVVNLIAFGECGGLYALVLESLPTCLADVYKELDWNNTLKIVKQVGAVLQITHKQGLIFVDLKPSNIMLDEATNVKLIDFGSATYAGEYIESDTQAYRARAFTKKPSSLKASEAGDVFTYGYLMEILLTKSELPDEPKDKQNRKKLKGKEIRNKNHKNLLNDKLLGPRGCNEIDAMKISNLVRQCKVLTPDDRPPLSKVLDSLNELKESRT